MATENKPVTISVTLKNGCTLKHDQRVQTLEETRAAVKVIADVFLHNKKGWTVIPSPYRLYRSEDISCVEFTDLPPEMEKRELGYETPS